MWYSALRLLVQHVVEADHRAHLRRRNTEDLRQLVLRPDRAVSELALNHVERRKYPRALPPLRVARQYPVNLLPHLIRNHSQIPETSVHFSQKGPVLSTIHCPYRSTSPNTMSIEPMLVTTSDSISPRLIWSMA